MNSKKETPKEYKSLTERKEVQVRLPIEPKYSQKWHQYNLAKTNEKRLFVELLHDLSKIIKEPKYQFGRPFIPLRDLFFSAGLKLYSNYSGRKIMSDLENAKGAGYISRTPHFNTLKDFFNCTATYDLLAKMLTLSAMPLRKLEDQYSIDSSGFGSYSEEHWQKVKWDKSKKKARKNYMKGHILIGTKTNVICECEITPGNFADIKQAPTLLANAKNNFPIKEVSCDKAYSSRMLYRIIQSLGAMPYIPFKRNAKEPDEDDPDIWNQMFLMFRDNQEEWGKKYHKRSNVETTFAMVKLRLGEALKSKNYVAQRNELMMKFICHNITCLIQEMYENGVQVSFDECSKAYVERKVDSDLITRPASKVQNEDF